MAFTRCRCRRRRSHHRRRTMKHAEYYHFYVILSQRICFMLFRYCSVGRWAPPIECQRVVL